MCRSEVVSNVKFQEIIMTKSRIDPFPYLMTTPAAIFIVSICFYPIFSGIFMGFTDMSLMNPGRWRFIGFRNFIEILHDAEFWNSILFTVIYTIVSVIFSYILGLICALFMNYRIFIRGTIRTVLLIPWVMPAVVSATAWIWLLNDQTGFINWLLKTFGIIKEPILFLAHAKSAKITVILFDIWKNFPFMSLILLSSMQSISSELYEAAYIDGSNGFQSFWRITMPLIKRASFLVLLLQSIWTFNSFDRIFLLTKGGLALATEVISIYAYNTAFFRSDLGYASALSITMMIFMIFLTIAYFKMSLKKGGEYD
jgi:multiple sugar transport system permease protein